MSFLQCFHLLFIGLPPPAPEWPPRYTHFWSVHFHFRTSPGFLLTQYGRHSCYMLVLLRALLWIQWPPVSPFQNGRRAHRAPFSHTGAPLIITRAAPLPSGGGRPDRHSRPCVPGGSIAAAAPALLADRAPEPLLLTGCGPRHPREAKGGGRR